MVIVSDNIFVAIYEDSGFIMGFSAFLLILLLAVIPKEYPLLFILDMIAIIVVAVFWMRIKKKFSRASSSREPEEPIP